jgi:hypothetical protein
MRGSRALAQPAPVGTLRTAAEAHFPRNSRLRAKRRELPRRDESRRSMRRLRCPIYPCVTCSPTPPSGERGAGKGRAMRRAFSPASTVSPSASLVSTSARVPRADELPASCRTRDVDPAHRSGPRFATAVEARRSRKARRCPRNAEAHRRREVRAGGDSRGGPAPPSGSRAAHPSCRVSAQSSIQHVGAGDASRGGRHGQAM